MAASQMMVMSHDMHSNNTPPPSRSDTSSFNVQIFVEAIILMSLSFFAITCQLLRSWLMRRQLVWQDKYLLAAFLCGFAMSTACAVMTTKGLGKHDYDGNIDINAKFQQAIIIINCFYFTCNFFVKMGLLAMFREFTFNPWGKRLCLFMEVTSGIFWIGSIIVEVLQCIPLSVVWTRGTVGICVDLGTFYHSNAAIMIAVDIVLYAMPLVFTWRTGMQKMSMGKKIGVRAVFALGIVCVCSSCVRLYIVHLVIYNGDMPYNYGRCLFFSALENHLAIVVACAAGIKGLFCKFIFPTFKTSLDSNFSKLSKLWTSTAESPPPSPNWRFRHFTPSSSPFGSHRGRSFNSFVPVESPATSHTTSQNNDGDIELGFHDSTCNFVPNMSTSCTTGSTSPRRPLSSRSRIYISRKITITEECNVPAPSPASPAKKEKDVLKKAGEERKRMPGAEAWSPREFADVFGLDDEDEMEETKEDNDKLGWEEEGEGGEGEAKDDSGSDSSVIARDFAYDQR